MATCTDFILESCINRDNKKDNSETKLVIIFPPGEATFIPAPLSSLLSEDGKVEWMLVSDNKPALGKGCCEAGGMRLGQPEYQYEG